MLTIVLTVYITGAVLLACMQWIIDGPMTIVDVADKLLWPIGLPWLMLKTAVRRLKP